MMNDSIEGAKNEAGLERLRQEIQVGKDDIEAGLYTELDSREALQEYMDDTLLRVLTVENNF